MQYIGQLTKYGLDFSERDSEAYDSAEVKIWLPKLQAQKIEGRWLSAFLDWCLAERTSLALKCDEGRPHCKRCTSFGVLCNFVSNIPDLQPIAADTGRPLVVRGKAELRPPIASAVWTSDEFISYQLNAKCQDFITRYLGRSLINPDDPNMIHVNRKLLRLAFAVSIVSFIFLPSDRIEAGLLIIGLSLINIWLTVPMLNARLSSCGIYI